MTFNSRIRRDNRAPTYEGGAGFRVEPEQELYLFSASSLMIGDTFYEKRDERLNRFRKLAQHVAVSDPLFMRNLAMYAREKLNLRQLPTLLVAELFLNGQAEHGRVAANRVWVRGDEHLEALAYADQFKDNAIPVALRKAVAAHLESMNEKQFMKYAREGRAVSQVDAVNLTHPKPRNPKQAALFKMLMEGWDRLTGEEQELLPKYRALKEDGTTQTWEQEISAKGSTAETWTGAVQKMGHMALIRNLRNLVEKGVPEDVMLRVADRVADAQEVRYGKQLPFRYVNAYNALPNNAPRVLREAVSVALDYSLENVPELPGRTLVLVDESGSMEAGVSGGTWATRAKPDEMSRKTIAGIFGAAVYKRSEATLVPFGSGARVLHPDPRGSVLSIVEALNKADVGHATNMGAAVEVGYSANDRYDRVVSFSDMQAHDDPWARVQRYQPGVPVFAVNLAGYPTVAFNPRSPNVVDIGGFSDKLFDFIRAAERTDPVGFIRKYA